MALQSKQFSFDTPATEWIVNHGLGKYVTSDVFLFDANNRPAKALPLELIYIDENTVKVVFSQPQRGFIKVI